MALRLLLVWLIACGVVAAPALAQQAVPPPPQEPILRIDPGMHTASIFRIGVDAACTLLATGSHDKTVRLWRLPEGKLLRTLRPPIGPGNGGKVHAVVLAPDGSWVAAGGWDAAWSAGQSMYVYIFQASTGALITRLGPLGSVINHLAVSADGRYLAATLGVGQGVRVWERTADGGAAWRLVLDDRDYGGQDVYGAAIDREGALYTVAYDGKLRRYAPGFQGRPTWVTTRGGQRPFSVAVHPSGDSVVVGHQNATAVEVYDVATLAWKFAADTTFATKASLLSVSWSADGARLYAGGTFARVVADSTQIPILVWDLAGKGRVRELGGPENTVQHMLPCGDGIAMGAQDPAFGLLSRDGSRLAWQKPVLADYRAQHGGQHSFSVDADGRRVRFGLEFRGRSPVLFDLTTEQLTAAPASPGDFVGADTTGLPVTDWLNNPNPKLGGTPIKLQQFERSRSLAISPDRQRFVLGTEWLLRGYDKEGKELWPPKDLPGTAWAVNIARDGKLVLAAHGDGTIRWYHLDNGRELLALFVHKVDRRWVAWTPKGYYMASPGAESLIGWHVNRDWTEAPRFYPVDRFRAQFNRPDIVKLVLETLDEGKAIDEANRRARTRHVEEDVRKLSPPIVVIQSPGDGSPFRTSEATIEYNVFSAAGRKVTKVDYFINSAALDGARLVAEPTPDKTTSYRVTLPVPPGDVTISVVAYEGDRASEPASIRLRWDGAKPGQVALPRLRALFVGINGYTSPNLTKLSYAVKDATDLASFFKGQEGKSYLKVEAKVLSDAKRLDVIEGLEWLQKGSEEGDINLLFLAGHGATIEQDFYFMAADSDPDKARATAVSRDDIQRAVLRRRGTMVVMLDACRSGAGTEAGGKSPVDMNKTPNELGDKASGVLLYASASGQQYSYERAEWGNGAFTKAMLEGLTGKADIDKDGYVDSEELSLYVRGRVVGMTKGQQVPVRVKPDAAPEMKLVLLK